MKLTRLSRWQKFKHWLGLSKPASTNKGPALSVIEGGKIKLRDFDAKATVYNPREFRADKGPRK